MLKMMKTVTKGQHKGKEVKVLGESATWANFMRVELPNGKIVNQHKAILK
jgi:major membrane immunogen (membrane-anchored lipoprotein)